MLSPLPASPDHRPPSSARTGGGSEATSAVRATASQGGTGERDDWRALLDRTDPQIDVAEAPAHDPGAPAPPPAGEVEPFLGPLIRQLGRPPSGQEANGPLPPWLVQALSAEGEMTPDLTRGVAGSDTAVGPDVSAAPAPAEGDGRTSGKSAYPPHGSDGAPVPTGRFTGPGDGDIAAPTTVPMPAAAARPHAGAAGQAADATVATAGFAPGRTSQQLTGKGAARSESILESRPPTESGRSPGPREGLSPDVVPPGPPAASAQATDRPPSGAPRLAPEEIGRPGPPATGTDPSAGPADRAVFTASTSFAAAPDVVVRSVPIAQLQATVAERLAAAPPPETPGRAADPVFARTVEIELAPADLGRLRLVLHTNERGLHLAVSIERPEMVETVRRHLDGLNRALISEGVTLDSVDIGTGDRRGREPAGDGAPPPRIADPDTPEPSSTPLPPPPVRLPDGRLDLSL